jgi:CheY-like chemotaxis protein
MLIREKKQTPSSAPKQTPKQAPKPTQTQVQTHVLDQVPNRGRDQRQAGVQAGETDPPSGSQDVGERSAFEQGFRAGRAEGMLALVDAMTRSLNPLSECDPRADLEPQTEATPASSRAGLGFGEAFTAKARPSILIVDDEPINIDLLIDNLETDFEILAATDGKAALETALRELPDLVLLDILMPGIDGFEVCRRLKSNRLTQNIPVIFITALQDAADEIRALELGAQDFLTKPIEPKSVKARVQSQVKLKHAHDKLLWLATLEQRLRENLFAALESKNGLN